MREVFSEAWRIMARRKNVIWQFLALIPAIFIVVLVGVLIAMATGSSGLAIFLSFLLMLFGIIFIFGAAYGAIGEATWGNAPTPYFLRGWHLFGKTAAYLGTGVVAGLAVLLVADALSGALFGATMSQTALLHQLTPGANPAQAMSAMLGVLVRVGIVTLVVSVAVFPLLYGLAAGLFAGRMTYSAAFDSAGQEYVHGRFPQWLLVWAIYTVGIAIYEGAYLFSITLLIPGNAGGFALFELISVVFVLLLGWYITALAFALWSSHQPKQAVATDNGPVSEPAY
ncbi:MAG: hypothetical protein M0Z66_05080 [Thermaerobacter sp.]|nr:hypothetical protein [Thermaerobacter sp.]